MQAQMRRTVRASCELLTSQQLSATRSGISWADCASSVFAQQRAWESELAERKYPFKAPLKRVKVGGRWMDNPAARAAKPTDSRPAPQLRRPSAPSAHARSQHVRLALPHGASDAVVHLGRRLGRPLLTRIGRVRATQATGLAEEDRPYVVKHDIWEEEALSHNTGLQLLFLGTGRGHPAEQRRMGSVAMKLLRSTWLFDCGEDTQRQVHKQPLIRHGKLDRIFITNCSASNILGLPGMLCTMSAAREVGLDLADIPLHIYGPPGLAEFIRPLLQLSDTFISMPIIVHELVSHAVAPAEMREPRCLDRRSCLYRVLLPPDRLNPQGHYDGVVAPFLTRATSTTNQLAKGLDERSNPRDFELPPPGDPDAQLRGLDDMRWTIRCDRETMVVAQRVPADTPSWAFVCQEVDRVGRLDVARCEELRIPKGLRYGQLKEGLSITNADGETVRPEQVLGPDIPGRKIVVVGESTDSMPLAELARGADAVVHCASAEVKEPSGLKTLRSCIDHASAFSRTCEAQHLILYRFKPGQEEGEMAPYRRVDPSVSELADSEREQEGLARSLNTLGRLEWTKKDALGGYLRRSRHHWEPIDSPPEAVRAAEDFASGLFGRPGRVSVADDMDLYAVERKIPKAAWEQRGAQEAAAPS